MLIHLAGVMIELVFFVLFWGYCTKLYLGFEVILDYKQGPNTLVLRKPGASSFTWSTGVSISTSLGTQ